MYKQTRISKLQKSILYILYKCKAGGREIILKRDIRNIINTSRANPLMLCNLNTTLDVMESRGMIETKLVKIKETGKVTHRACSITDKGMEIYESSLKEEFSDNKE